MFRLNNLLTILRKELLIYFITFSNFLVFASVVGVVLFIFFSNFFLTNIAQLDQLFSLFPWVFALLVPAVTMGIIAQERRSHTLQYLFANPINEIEITVGKFIAALLFLLLFPVLTLVAPLMLQQVATFDWGVIASGYLGVILLMGLFLAANLFVSSLFTNQLAAFMLAFLTNFGLILLGSDLVTSIFPSVFLDVFSQLSPMVHFENISRGLLNLGDVAYFLLATGGFMFLAYWQLVNVKYIGSPRKMLTLEHFSSGTIGVALLASCYFTYFLPGQIDITSQRIYTLSDGTKQIVSSVAEPVTIDFFLSRDLPPAFQPRVEVINRLLDQLTRVSPDKIKINHKYPQEDPAVAQEAATIGVYPQSFSVFSQSEYQAKDGYLGMKIGYQDASKVIPFVGDTSDLEYQILSRIYEMSLAEKPQVSYLQPAEGTNLMIEGSGLLEALGSTYEVKPVLINGVDGERLKGEDLVGSKVILLADLNFQLHPDDIGLIRDQVNAGASLIVFDGGVELNLSNLSVDATGDVYVNELIKNWGIEIQKDLVYDLRNANVLTFGSPQGQVLVSYPFWPTIGVTEEIPLLKEVGGVVVPWSSSVTITGENEQTSARKLLFTGNYGGLQTEIFNLAPQQQLSEQNLGVRVMGAIRSRSSNEGSVIVIGSPYMVLDNYNTGRNNNMLFVSQLFDLAAQSDSLASIRIKNRLAPQLVLENEQQKETIRLVSIGGAPSMGLLIGVVFIYLRKRRKLLYLTK